MEVIRAGQILAMYLYDVAEAIDLQRAAQIVGSTARARLEPKGQTPAYLQYQQPPLVIEGETVGLPLLGGARVAYRVFDYGVVSMRLSRDFSGSWSQLSQAAQGLMENETVERQAEQACRALADRLGPSLKKPRDRFLSEDYLVFIVHELDRRHTSDALVLAHGDVVAGLLRGEPGTLSRQEREEVLNNRISYLSDDLVIPTWNAAFVYDTPAGSLAAIDICESANSQLLQFRYYDDLLDDELERIYADLQSVRWYSWILGRHYVRAARHIHALVVDVNELTDSTENALKVIGDVYAARLFWLVGARLDLNRWKTNVREKLKTLDDIYRFSVEQVSIWRGQFLEATIEFILLFELLLFFLGIMR
jgi:hypothetical protein